MGHDFGGEPRLVMAAGGVRWLNAFVAGLLVLNVVIVTVFTASGLLTFWGAFASCAGILLTGIFIWAILPNRFEVYDDRLVVVFGFWRWNIGLGSIEVAREAGALQSYAYWGVRFSTAPRQAVEVRRVGSNMLTRPNMIISPEDRGIFLAELNAALTRHRRLHGS